MAVTVRPGYVEKNDKIDATTSVCKKCIAPKPTRTHHCSVCDRCVLKMDHHCPWLNNCVGFHNHRYFFLYMFYMLIGVVFVMIFGADIAYATFFAESDELEGHPVKINNQTGALIPIIDPHETQIEIANLWRRRSIIYMALINAGAFFALGGLVGWHARLISRGETSIEGHINKTMRRRFKEMNRVYRNPYDFGVVENWRMFLGVMGMRTFVRCVLLPSTHKPEGDGYTWRTVHQQKFYYEYL